MIYFDNAATTKVSDDIIEIVSRYMKSQYGNAGSIHSVGTTVKRDLDKARLDIAECIKATSKDQIIFTSGGSESNTLAIVGLMKYLISIDKPCIITSAVEHPSVIKTMEFMEECGFTILTMPVNRKGEINIHSLELLVKQYPVGLVSIMGVNNEIGSTQNLFEIGKICRKYDTLFHTDCVQAAGIIDIDVEAMEIDFLSMSGHKFHAPKGVGFLYARDKELLSPIIHGGDQEFSLRAGTENVPGIIGMAKALKNIYETPVSYSNIKKNFVEHIESLCQKEKIEVIFNGNSKTNRSKIVSLRFPNIDGQTLLLMLNSRGVCVSAGSACKSHSNKPSHVLQAIGLTEDDALSTIRISFSKYNTLEEVMRGAEIIVQCVKEMSGGIYDK